MNSARLLKMATVGTMCVRTAHKISRLTNSLLLRPASMRADMRFSTIPENSKADSTEKNGAEKPPPESTENKPSEIETKLKEEKEQLDKNLKDMKDKYMRSLAETENVRTRMRKQVDDAKVFGIQGFCKDLLDVADILGRATESVPQEELNDKNVHLMNLFQGLTMTNTELIKVFNKHGLQQILPKEGDKFDPFIHEALFEVPTEEKDKGSKIAVIQKTGYKLHDRTIRPALVGVFKS